MNSASVLTGLIQYCCRFHLLYPEDVSFVLVVTVMLNNLRRRLKIRAFSLVLLVANLPAGADCNTASRSSTDKARFIVERVERAEPEAV